MRDRSLETALDYIARDAREMVVDSVYCSIFNLANNLAGNTEQSDIDWLARELWLAVDPMRVSGRWDSLGQQEQEHWHELAKASLVAVEKLMGRLERRCRDHATVLKAMLQQMQRERRR